MSPRAKKRAKAKAAKALKNGGVGDGGPDYPRLQIQNGGVSDGSPMGAGKGGAKGLGKGKGDTFEGKPICYNWNRGAPCKDGANCQMAHVCLICKKPDHPKIRHGA